MVSLPSYHTLCLHLPNFVFPIISESRIHHVSAKGDHSLLQYVDLMEELTVSKQKA